MGEIKESACTRVVWPPLSARRACNRVNGKRKRKGKGREKQREAERSRESERERERETA